MVGKAEWSYYTNNRLRSAYQGSLMNAAVTAAKSGKDHKQGFKNFKKFLKKNLPAKGGWNLKEMKADDYSDIQDLRDTSSNPKEDGAWQFQHDILADLHSAQDDDFKLKTNDRAPWVAPMFEQKGFGMNAPFSGSGIGAGGTYSGPGGGGFSSSPWQSIPVGNMGISGALGPRGIGTGNTDQSMPGGILNTGSFYDLAINPVRGGERQGFGLGGYTVMQ